MKAVLTPIFKRRLRKVATTVTVAAFAAASVAADPPIGSRLGDRQRRGASSQDATALQGAHAFADCLYNKRKFSVRSVLDAEQPDELKRHDRVLRKDIQCMSLPSVSPFAEGLALDVPPDVFRGLLAEAVIDDLRLPPLKPLPLQPAYQREWFAMTGRDAVIDEMAVCVAETNPAAVSALFKTYPESSDEKAAVGALAPSLGPCLRVGAKLTANRQSLRAALAEALYHRIFTPLPAAVDAAPVSQ